ncbi:MAG: DUF721 domain-containing protein [Microcystaceae cyanobacterium]
MSFNSLDQVLAAIEKQPGWEIQQQYRRLLECWPTVVEPKVALQTRPLYIVRNVLWVATSSSAWAQTLSLQRYSLLKQLNTYLPEPLVEIRFSPAQWYNQTGSIDRAQHSSLLGTNTDTHLFPELLPENTPQSAFQRWAQSIETRSQHLSLCPRCQCPTPPDELQLWTLCAYCVTQQWTSALADEI